MIINDSQIKILRYDKILYFSYFLLPGQKQLTKYKQNQKSNQLKGTYERFY